MFEDNIYTKENLIKNVNDLLRRKKEADKRPQHRKMSSFSEGLFHGYIFAINMFDDIVFIPDEDGDSKYGHFEIISK